MWRTCLDDHKVVGAILTDLYKAFDIDFLPNDLLIAKLEAYGWIDSSVLKLIASYLTGPIQCVKNNDIRSLFKEIL